MLGGPDSLGIVIAVQRAETNLPEILERLRPENHPNVQYLFCYTDADPQTADLVSGPTNVRTLHCTSGSPIPHLWRDGIVTLKTERIAVTTAHCIPSENWVDKLVEADLSRSAGIGGLIDNHSNSDGVGWAIFMLRYLPFGPPQGARQTGDIAADNAVYRRADIMRHDDLLSEGFWEPSFHARFTADGEALRIEPDLLTYHRNCYGAVDFANQRFVHGRAFGLARVCDADAAKRWFRLATVPLLPAVFFLKILSRVFAHKKSLTHLPAAFPWLIFFVLAWIAGEATGYVDGLKSSPPQPKKALSS